MFESDELDSIFASLEGPRHKTAPAAPKRVRRYGRIAFADLLFSWPPNGGADTDLFNVIKGLHEYGHQVHLFVAHERGSTDRGRVDPQGLPFPATRLDFPQNGLSRESIAARFREAVDAWFPEVVVATHGYALKPYLMQALSHHPLVARYFAHELTCLKDPLRFRDGAPCPNDYLRGPEECRRCSLEAQRTAIQQGNGSTWTREYLAARAYAPEHHENVVRALNGARAVIVSNAALRADLKGFHDNVFIVPGGVDTAQIRQAPPRERKPGNKKIILMVGRADDPLKGLDLLFAAGEELARERQDFEIWATHFDFTLSRDWFRAMGWRDHAGALALYPLADICVAPSIWEEPFGLTAVEAMAAARPVIASRVGGLQDIVRHGETGLLFQRGNAGELAGALRHLLDRADLRERLGKAGRAVAVAEYDWQRIIEERYAPMLESLMP